MQHAEQIVWIFTGFFCFWKALPSEYRKLFSASAVSGLSLVSRDTKKAFPAGEFVRNEKKYNAHIYD